MDTDAQARALYAALAEERRHHEYIWPGYKYCDLGCGMAVLVDTKIGGWRERYLLNELHERAYELVGFDHRLKCFTTDDIDWSKVEEMHYSVRAYKLQANFPFSVGRFEHGVAYVEWTLWPDDRYFCDADGYGHGDGIETKLGAYIDTACRVLVKFQPMSLPSTRARLRAEAEKMAVATLPKVVDYHLAYEVLDAGCFITGIYRSERECQQQKHVCIQVQNNSLVLPGAIDGRPVVGVQDFCCMGRPMSSASLPFEEIDVLEGCTSIGEKCFSQLPNLQTVYIPISMERIATGAFSCCARLTEVHFSAIKEFAGNSLVLSRGCFSGAHPDLRIYWDSPNYFYCMLLDDDAKTVARKLAEHEASAQTYSEFIDFIENT